MKNKVNKKNIEIKNQKKLENKNLISSFGRYLKLHKGLLVLSLLAALIYVITTLSLPLLFGKAINLMAVDPLLGGGIDFHNILIYVIISLTLMLVGVIFYYIFESSVSLLSYKIVFDIRQNVFRKYTLLPISFIDSRTLGDLMQLNCLDIENINQGLLNTFKQFYIGIMTILVTIIFMFILNYILAFTVIILSPLSILVSRFIAKRSSSNFKKQASESAKMNAFSYEYLDNLKLLQSLNYQDTSKEEFKDLNSSLTTTASKAIFSSSWVNPSTRLVNNTIYAIVGIIGIILYALVSNSFDTGVSNESYSKFLPVINIGIISSFLTYTNSYTKPFNEVSSVLAEINTAISSYKRVYHLLSEKEDDTSKETFILTDEIDSIEFKNVSFGYSKDKKVLSDISFKVNKGEKIAIVGTTGCGKTTLINLLMRFYDQDEGQILFNGVSNTSITKNSLRSHFGMVLQDTWVFSSSIIENVRYAKPTASDEEVKEACKKANADNFIQSLPEGYDTIIKDKLSLSEGEKQLLTIARCFLLYPEIMILDEATSAIDTRTEMLITSAFDKVMKDRTCFIIAHRLSTIVNANKILVMDKGQIIEVGDHDSLLKLGGFYSKLYNSQFDN